MTITTTGHNIDEWDDEAVGLMVDHLCREFGSKDAMFRHARRLPQQERIAKYRHMLAGTLEDLLPSAKYGAPKEGPLPLPSFEPVAQETLEAREDRALASTSALLNHYTDAQWEAMAAKNRKDVESFRRETWSRIFNGKRKYD